MAIRYSTLDLNSTNVRSFKLKQFALRFFLMAMWHSMRSLTERALTSIFFAPRMGRLTESERRWLETGRVFKFVVHGKTVLGRQYGNGPGVLFIHGWNGRSTNFHRFFNPVLEAGYSVIAFDAPAHGFSEGKTTNFFEFTDAVKAILKSDKHDGIMHVIAHSLGAGATINAMAMEKQNIDMTLIAPALDPGKLLTRAFSHFGIPESIWRSIIGRLEQQLEYNLDRDIPARLIDGIKSRLLIVHDKSDKTTPYEDSKVVSAAYSHVCLFTTKGLGHKRILKDDTVIEQVVNRLMNRNFLISDTPKG
jgi:hypothetical protein